MAHARRRPRALVLLHVKAALPLGIFAGLLEFVPAVGPIMSDDQDGAAFPLYRRFPALSAIPRVRLCDLPSPVMHAEVDGAEMWIKRDDLNAPVSGGNKVRSLEFLLAGVHRGDTVVTVGGEGSTHVLATAIHARRLGARTVALRWRHEMNESAVRTAELIEDECVIARVHRTTIGAVIRAHWARATQHMHYVPLGGATPLGVLAQVNAGLELADQIQAGLLPRPDRVVVPLGSGGTVAGIALGFAIAELDTAVIGVQVTPAIIANRTRVKRLVSRTAHLIQAYTGETVPRVRASLLGVARNAYGGAYGRPVPAAIDAANKLRDATGIQLDHTYSGKAFAVALGLARTAKGITMFWNTFDSRLTAR